VFSEALLTDIASARQEPARERLSFGFKQCTTAMRIKSGKVSKGKAGSELDILLHSKRLLLLGDALLYDLALSSGHYGRQSLFEPAFFLVSVQIGFLQ
jgi:hypothetical protein